MDWGGDEKRSSEGILEAEFSLKECIQERGGKLIAGWFLHGSAKSLCELNSHRLT